MKKSLNKQSGFNATMLHPTAFGVTGICGTKRVSCIVKKSGRLGVYAKSGSKINKAYNTYLIRGFVFLFFGVYNTLLGLFEFNSVYCGQEVAVVTKAKNSLNVSIKSVIYFIVALGGVICSYLLLGILPIKLSYYLSPKNFDVVLKRFIIGILKCLIIYIAFLILKVFRVFRQYFKFNSAIKKHQDEARGVNFLTYFICSTFLCVMTLSVLGLTLNAWYSVFINLFVGLIIYGANYELFKEVQKGKIAKYVIVPFYFLIKENPSQNETKCVKIVLKELEQGSTKTMDTVEEGKVLFSEAYVTAKEKLENAGKFEKSDLDFIFCEILNKNRAEVKLTKEITKPQFAQVLKAVQRRALGEPITKIFGHANFCGLDFKVTKDVLSPRMDTEILVEEVLKNCSVKTKVLDIGTGSGAIAVTIAKMAKCKVTAVDISNKALEVAKQNAKQNGVSVAFKKSDIFLGLSKFAKFDIIVSNPPYIPSASIDGLDEEVKKHDPLLALDGGKTGLDFYEKIIEDAPKRLNKNGKIFFEIGIGQAKDVKKLLQKNFKDIRIVKDYNKIERVVVATCC